MTCGECRLLAGSLIVADYIWCPVSRSVAPTKTECPIPDQRQREWERQLGLPKGALTGSMHIRGNVEVSEPLVEEKH